MRSRILHLTPAERRLRREAQSAARRERAFALRQTGATYAEIGAALGLSLERARQIVKKAERLRDQPRWHDKLPTRALNFLRNHELDSLPEIDAARAVARHSRRELLRMPNFGKASLNALSAWLAGHGLKLREASPSNEGAPASQPGRPHSSDSNQTGPLLAGRSEVEEPWLYPPPTT